MVFVNDIRDYCFRYCKGTVEDQSRNYVLHIYSPRVIYYTWYSHINKRSTYLGISRRRYNLPHTVVQRFQGNTKQE